jgi:hypothetical protein
LLAAVVGVFVAAVLVVGVDAVVVSDGQFRVRRGRV